MTASAAYDVRTGALTATPTVLGSLLSGDAGSELARSGAWQGGRPHPGLVPALDALRDPVGGTLRVSYRGRALDGWIGAARTVLRTPVRADGRATLVRVHPTLVPAAIAKVVALQPRPPAREPSSAEALAVDPAVVRWWTLAHGPSASRAGAWLEVVDTDGGMYVVADDGAVTPTDPSAVFRAIVSAVVGEPAPTPPVRALPATAGLPGAWTP